MVFGELSPSPSYAARKSDRSSPTETRRRVSIPRTSKRRPSTDSESGPQIAPDQSPTRPSQSANSNQTPSTAALKRPQDTSSDVFDATIPQKRTCTSNTNTAHASGQRADSEEIYSRPKTQETARLTHAKLCNRIRTKLSDDDRIKGVIYVFRHPTSDGSVWKIGTTKRLYNERFDEHKNCCKFEPDPFHVSAQEIQNCNLLEKLIHMDLCYQVRYRSCTNRTKGHDEWFEVSEYMAVETVKKWERFIHEGKPYDSQGNLNVVWSYVLEQRSPAALNVRDMSHDARHEQWADILAPPTYSDYVYAYSAYARSELKATYDWVYMFFWQLLTILYSLHALALCRNRPAFYALVFVLGCAVLPSFRLQSTEKQKVRSPKKKA